MINNIKRASKASRKRSNVSMKKDDVYEVENIVAKRINEKSAKGEYEYLVEWKGYTSDSNTWEPAKHLTNAADAIAAFERRESNIERIIENIKTHKEENNENSKKDETDKKSDDIDNDDNVIPDSITKCSVCEEEFSNESALHVHRFHEHAIQVPVNRLKEMPLTDNVEAFKILQQSDPELRFLYNTKLGTEGLENLSVEQRRIINNNEFILSENGLLYCIELTNIRSRSKINTQLRLCIPKTERQRLLYEYHNNHAHPGIIHLYDSLRENVWWPRMLSHVVKYIRKCVECQHNKSIKHKYLPRAMNIPYGPWTHLAIDHIGPFPTSNGGNVYILVIIDRFTRFAEAFPCKDESAYTTAEIIVEKIICRYGFMTVLQSDRGSGFTSILMQQILKQLNIRKIKTTAFHPQSNGVVEINNKQLKKTLKLWVNEQQNDWDVLLPYALFAYNTAVHRVIQQTPYYLNYGRKPRTITDQITENEVRNNGNTHVYAYELAEKLYKVHQRVREIYEKINEDRENALENEKVHTYKIGDQVLLYDPTTPRHKSRKLVRRWKGPYTIIRISDVNVTIMKNDTEMLVHAERLRPFQQGTESIEDQHKNEIELAEEELKAINQLMSQMHVRKQRLLTEKSISEAGMQLEIESNNNENVAQNKDDENVKQSTTTQTEEEESNKSQIYDDDDEEVEAIAVNSLSFIDLWY